jgi:hypothetical protein
MVGHKEAQVQEIKAEVVMAVADIIITEVVEMVGVTVGASGINLLLME